MRLRWLILCAVFSACSSSLPSTEPLGVGPMAERGDAGARKLGQAGAADGGIDAAAPPPAPVAEAPPKDGGSEGATASSAPPITPDAGAGGSTGAGGSGGKAAALAVSGEYIGWDTTSYRIPNVPESPQRDPNARTRVTQGSGDAIEITIINSSNGQDLCKVKGKLKAGTATLDKGQRCFEEGEEAMTATLRKGVGRFSGKQLILDLEFDLSIDTGQGDVKGDVLYHFEGNRK